MSTEIIKVLDALAEKFGIAVDWTASNAIPYLEQLCKKYVNYEIATSIVWMVIGVMLLLVAVVLIRMIIKDKIDDEEVLVFCAIIAGVFGIVGMALIICQTFDIVTCLTFPEKIIIDEIKSIYSDMNRN